MKIEKTSGDSGHVGDVTCVFVHQNHVYSAGSDGKIKVFSNFLHTILNLSDFLMIFAIDNYKNN